jgi:protein-L-isoaspartate(D-aspartate) O-methyltransferase
MRACSRPDAAPFDRIILTAAPAEVPAARFGELAEGGVLVAPVGPEGGTQTLLQFRKTGAIVSPRKLGSVWFVPMVPAAQ